MSREGPKIPPFWSRDPLLGGGEIFSPLGDGRGTSLFLGKFTLGEVMAVLGRKGFIKEARRRGLWPLVTGLDSSAYPCQRFRIFAGAADPEKLIVDLKIREGTFSPRLRLGPGTMLRDFSALFLEWLTLQNPASEFTERRGALPGQQHPGLGMSRRIVDIFVYLAKVSRADALLAFPAYYHNAILFSRFFQFLNPVKEAEVRSIRQAFGRMPIKPAAWAVHLGCLRAADGTVYEWTAEEQVAPFSKDLRDYFDSKAYREAVREALSRFRFTLDPEDFERKIGSFD